MDNEQHAMARFDDNGVERDGHVLHESAHYAVVQYSSGGVLFNVVLLSDEYELVHYADGAEHEETG